MANATSIKRKSEFGPKGPTPKKTKKSLNSGLQKPIKKLKTNKGTSVEKPKDKKTPFHAETNESNQDQIKKSKFAKSQTGPPGSFKQTKANKFVPKGKTEKIEDWNKFKKQKKELKLKRKQSKSGFDVIVRAKQIGEELRRRVLKGGEQKRVQLINELHSLLKGKGHYAKFVVAHDTARIVQWLLKYASNIVIQQISKELIPETVNMLHSKYGVFCVKRLLKYGTSDIRSQTIEAMFNNVVKLASHVVSAPVVEYAFSTWATPIQKQYMVQEFYGDLYKRSKDSSVKHLKDVYKTNESLKAATLGAVKTNLTKILNKSLLDSGIVHTVLWQYLTECSEDDKKELIAQLVPHIVVISNSKEGARAAMQCIWHGSNKDRKVIMKTMKEHLIDLSKHEHGHATVISLLDSIDDTVLLHKIILSELLKSVKDLAVSEWGRKVLLWLVAPADTTYFHPTFVKELTEGREASSCKKSAEIRRKEVLQYSLSTLLNMISEDAEFWLSNASLATEMNAIIKAGE
nr:unnamed protein product [Callosobruchus analis]